MQVLQEAYGLEGDRLWTAGAGFGGGMGRTQSVCGAITGAVIALGLREGRLAEERQRAGGEAELPKNTARPKVRGFLEGFRDTFGEIECRKLLDWDFNVPGGYQAFDASGKKKDTCQRYTEYVVRTLVSQ